MALRYTTLHHAAPALPRRVVTSRDERDSVAFAPSVCQARVSLTFAASIVGDGVGGRPGQQDGIGREIDAVRPVDGIEDQVPLVGRARRGEAGNFQTS